MDFERKSSGVAKGGLTTGIIGTSLGALALLGQGGSLVGNLLGNKTNCCVENVIPVAVPMNNWGWGGWNHGRGGRYCDGGDCCSENMLVNRYELELQQKIAEKDSQIALRDANTYNDQKMLEMYKYVDGKFNAIERQLCAQEVQNQATKDSFQLVRQEADCCCRRLEDKICDEKRERKCADNTIVTYTNATFYPKQVADVTTGTTTTAQTTYNPLPVETCGCCCGN